MNTGGNIQKESIIEVTWLDACSEDAHLTIDAVRNLKPLTRRNVGYKLDMTDDYITISTGAIENLYHGETCYDKALTIPKGMIIEVRELS